MEKNQSLAPHTGKIFDAISQLDCIKPFTLVGGTALSLQIAKRQSEDLDFMKWISRKGDKPDVQWNFLMKELQGIGELKDYEVGGFDFVNFNLEGVRISFYNPPRRAIPSMTRIHHQYNLYLADMETIGAMKMETMLRRSKFRDYYDIYSILLEGGSLEKMIDAAIQHSGYKLKLRGLLSMLTNGAMFHKESGFENLCPVYDVSAEDIQEYIKSKLIESQDERLQAILGK